MAPLRSSAFIQLLAWALVPSPSFSFQIFPNRPVASTAPSVLSLPPLRYQVDEELLEKPFVLTVLERKKDVPLPAERQYHRLEESFAAAKEKGEAAFVSFVTAGYPTAQDTPSILLAMQEGGASVIELGVPFSDPQADGPTIQHTNRVALENGTTRISQVLDMLREARAVGLTVPVILMGYYNPVHQYQSGLEAFCRDSKDAGADGVLIVDLPPEEATRMYKASEQYGLSNIPLVTPRCSDERIEQIASWASTFLYCVSVAGVTGARSALPDNLESFVERVRAKTELPLAVGFGISNAAMVQGVANIADGVVVGSAISKALMEIEDVNSTTDECSAVTRRITKDLVSGCRQSLNAKHQATLLSQSPKTPLVDNSKKYFGRFGGQFIPELLMEPLDRLEAAYRSFQADKVFQQEATRLVDEFVTGPTPLQKAEALTSLIGGAAIWLKRDDLARGCSRQMMNNVVHQALMAKKLEMSRVIAESITGNHGMATATVCKRLGLECTIYMGKADAEKIPACVSKMQKLGATVVPVSGHIKDAVNEASRDLVAHIDSAFYVASSATGPHPFPTIVRDLKSVLGLEIQEQLYKSVGKQPNAIVASVGKSHCGIGAFYPFLSDCQVDLYGVESEQCAPLSKGTPGVLHGAFTYLVQEPESGQIADCQQYPLAEPEHSYLMETRRANFDCLSNLRANQARSMVWWSEGILTNRESSRAIAKAIAVAKNLGPGQDIVVSLS